MQQLDLVAVGTQHNASTADSGTRWILGNDTIEYKVHSGRIVMVMKASLNLPYGRESDAEIPLSFHIQLSPHNQKDRFKDSAFHNIQLVH